MQNKYRYPHEKFMLAVDGMATSSKSIQERIGSAYIYHLIHLQSAELPDEIQEIFDSFSQKLRQKTLMIFVKYTEAQKTNVTINYY